jgi:hypothetical protein
MKKVIFILAFSLFALTSYGQNKVKFGVNSGLNYASLRGNAYSENLAANFSYLGGLSFEYFLKDNLSIGANLNYENKTAKDNGYLYLMNQDGFGERVKSDAKINYSYLVLPVYVSYYFTPKKDFYVNGGLFVGYLLNSKFTSKRFNDTTDTTDKNKSTDGGLVLGFGKVFKLNEKNDLKLELRENFGLVNTSDVEVYNDGTIKTNSFNLILNWSFNL